VERIPKREAWSHGPFAPKTQALGFLIPASFAAAFCIRLVRIIGRPADRAATWITTDHSTGGTVYVRWTSRTCRTTFGDLDPKLSDWSEAGANVRSRCGAAILGRSDWEADFLRVGRPRCRCCQGRSSAHRRCGEQTRSRAEHRIRRTRPRAAASCGEKTQDTPLT